MPPFKFNAPDARPPLAPLLLSCSVPAVRVVVPAEVFEPVMRVMLPAPLMDVRPLKVFVPANMMVPFTDVIANVPGDEAVPPPVTSSTTPVMFVVPPPLSVSVRGVPGDALTLRVFAMVNVPLVILLVIVLLPVCDMMPFNVMLFVPPHVVAVLLANEIALESWRFAMPDWMVAPPFIVIRPLPKPPLLALFRVSRPFWIVRVAVPVLLPERVRPPLIVLVPVWNWTPFRVRVAAAELVMLPAKAKFALVEELRNV